MERKNWIKTALISTALAVGLFAAGYYAGIGLLAVLALFIPMLFVYLRAKAGAVVTVVCVLAFSVLVFLMAGWRVAVTAAACTLVVALPTGYIIRRRASFYFSELVSCGAMAAALGILLLSAYLLWGKSVTELYVDLSAAWYTANPDVARLSYYFTEGMQVAQTGDVNAVYALSDAVMTMPIDEVVPALMKGTVASAMAYIPQLCGTCVPLFGLLNYLIPRARLKKKGIAVGALPPFSLWKLPNAFGWCSVALLAIALLGEGMGWQNFETGAPAIIMFLDVIYSVQGMAFVNWLLRNGVRKQGVRTLIIVFSYILFSAIHGYMWLGLAEQFLKMRFRESAK